MNELLVAPEMSTSSSCHWYEKLTPVGDQVPGDAVSTLPTAAIPEIVGVPDVNVCRSALRINDALTAVRFVFAVRARSADPLKVGLSDQYSS